MPLNDYSIDKTKWKNAGNCDWQITTRKGTDDEYFIKRYLSPKYPREGSKFFDRDEKIATSWFKERKDIFDKVSSACRDTGSLVIPVEFFRDGHSYYKITRKVDFEKFISTDQISKLPMNDRLILLRIMCYALKHLHNNGIVHSDLKPGKLYSKYYEPGNILITKGVTGKYICKIIDFDDSFYEGKPPEVAPGTPEYYSPEIVMYNIGIGEIGKQEPDKTYRDKITCKSDIFALGLIFHEFLTGKQIEHEGYGSTGAKALHEELTLDESLPPCLSELLQSMVQKDYTKRPSIDQIIKTLRDCDNPSNSKADDERVMI